MKKKVLWLLCLTGPVCFAADVLVIGPGTTGSATFNSGTPIENQATVTDLQNTLTGSYSANNCVNNLNLLGHGFKPLKKPPVSTVGVIIGTDPDINNNALGGACQADGSYAPGAGTVSFFNNLAASAVFCSSCTIWFTACNVGSNTDCVKKMLSDIATRTGCHTCGYASAVVFGQIGDPVCQDPIPPTAANVVPVATSTISGQSTCNCQIRCPYNVFTTWVQATGIASDDCNDTTMAGAEIQTCGGKNPASQLGCNYTTSP